MFHASELFPQQKITSQLQRTVPSGDTPVCFISDKKLSKWDLVFLSLSKLAMDFFIHMFGAAGSWSSKNVNHLSTDIIAKSKFIVFSFKKFVFSNECVLNLQTNKY